ALVQALRSEENHRAMFRHAMFSEERESDISSSATYSMVTGKTVPAIRSSAFTSLSVVLMLLLGITGASAQVVTCRPLLSTKAVRDVRPSILQLQMSRWSATIVADTSFCATKSGNFEMDFIRIKDNAPDLQFTQTFRWAPKQFDISMELSAD